VGAAYRLNRLAGGKICERRAKNNAFSGRAIAASAPDRRQETIRAVAAWSLRVGPKRAAWRHHVRSRALLSKSVHWILILTSSISSRDQLGSFSKVLAKDSKRVNGVQEDRHASSPARVAASIFGECETISDLLACRKNPSFKRRAGDHARERRLMSTMRTMSATTNNHALERVKLQALKPRALGDGEVHAILNGRN
jgi:hypothetical protein